MLSIGEFARLGQVSPRMLRHYDEIGLLRPDRLDPTSGYRLYDVCQLGRLHRIVALRDLGFGLEQIQQILSEEISVEQLRGMLRLRRAQIEQTMQEERERLRAVEAHLRALEWSGTVELQEVVIKQTQPARVARATARGLTHADIAAAFTRLLPLVIGRLEAVGAQPGISIAVYEDEGGTAAEGEIGLHAGFEIGDQVVGESEGVHVVDLPVIEVAAATYQEAWTASCPPGKRSSDGSTTAGTDRSATVASSTTYGTTGTRPAVSRSSSIPSFVDESPRR